MNRQFINIMASAIMAAGCSPRTNRSTAPQTVRPLPEQVHGATVRPVGDDRRGYGTRTARQTFARLKTLGVNTVSILMEGRMRRLDDTDILAAPRSDLEAVRAALLDAHDLGLHTILVPHVYIEDGTWRGHIQFEDPKNIDLWWSSYGRFMHQAATLAAESGASLLSIGVELKSLSKRSDARERFGALIADVRRSYSGPLTYSANWDEAEQVRFWDMVDLVGVNGYYPLEPDPFRGAGTVARRLTALARGAKRPVLVVEVGYRSSPLSHKRPWEWPVDVEPVVDDAAQSKAWAAVLTHWLGAEGIKGLCVWVVPTDPDDPASEPRHGFNPLNKPAAQVLARAFGGAVAPTESR
ncbi:MAG: hypothetical protein AAF449_19145 [Myxococcota bacterium]